MKIFSFRPFEQIQEKWNNKEFRKSKKHIRQQTAHAECNSALFFFQANADDNNGIGMLSLFHVYAWKNMQKNRGAKKLYSILHFWCCALFYSQFEFVYSLFLLLFCVVTETLSTVR